MVRRTLIDFAITRQAIRRNRHSIEVRRLERTSDYLTHPVFNRYHSETEMLRYIFKLHEPGFVVDARA